MILKLIVLVFSFQTYAKWQSPSQLRYRSQFGECPSKVAGKLIINLLKHYEKNNSLYSLKRHIEEGRLDSKHFVTKYKVSLNPTQNLISFDLDCPSPLLKVNVFKDGGTQSYQAILVETGDLFDPAYEVVLRQENKLSRSLPEFALPFEKIDSDVQHKIASLISDMKMGFREKLSEIIIDESEELTMILTHRQGPTSVFLGKDEWPTKTKKLTKLIKYLDKKNKTPAVVNLTNLKKVVVKFSDNF